VEPAADAEAKAEMEGEMEAKAEMEGEMEAKAEMEGGPRTLSTNTPS
jgi:hypothetical protein